jgi:hypothetical protein
MGYISKDRLWVQSENRQKDKGFWVKGSAFKVLGSTFNPAAGLKSGQFNQKKTTIL